MNATEQAEMLRRVEGVMITSGGKTIAERWVGTYSLCEGRGIGYPSVVLHLIEELSQTEHRERVLKCAVEQLLCERDGDSGNMDDTLLEAEMEIQRQDKTSSAFAKEQK